jgi:hypothetical protein
MTLDEAPPARYAQRQVSLVVGVNNPGNANLPIGVLSNCKVRCRESEC